MVHVPHEERLGREGVRLDLHVGPGHLGSKRRVRMGVNGV